MSDEERAYRRYPGVPLEDCVRMLEHIVSRVGSGRHTSDDLAAALGLSATGGATKRKIAAITAFGLLDRSGGNYSVSKLGKSVLRPLPGERPTLLEQAWMSVPLYKEIYDAHASEGRLPASLHIVMERKFGISASSAEYASKVLLDSARFAGVVSDDGRFTLDKPESDREGTAESAPTMAQLAKASGVLQKLRTSNPETASITLVKPKCELVVPEPLTQSDAKRIASWLDAAVKPWLEFQVSENELDGEADA